MHGTKAAIGIMDRAQRGLHTAAMGDMHDIAAGLMQGLHLGVARTEEGLHGL